MLAPTASYRFWSHSRHISNMANPSARRVRVGLLFFEDQAARPLNSYPHRPAYEGRRPGRYKCSAISTTKVAMRTAVHGSKELVAAFLGEAGLAGAGIAARAFSCYGAYRGIP